MAVSSSALKRPSDLHIAAVIEIKSLIMNFLLPSFIVFVRLCGNVAEKESAYECRKWRIATLCLCWKVLSFTENGENGSLMLDSCFAFKATSNLKDLESLENVQSVNWILQLQFRVDSLKIF